MNLLAVFAMLTIAWTNPRLETDMPLFSQSVASVDNTAAGLINPAGLAPKFTIGLRYIHAFTDSSFKGEDGIMLASKGYLVSVQWLNHADGISRRKYTMSSGQRLFPKFYWGLSIARFGSSNDIYKSKTIWKIGFQYYPTRYFSSGLTVDGLNRPALGDYQTERFYTLGASYSSSDKKITFSIDAYHREKDDFENIESRLMLELRPVKSIKLVGDYRTEGYIQIGLIYYVNHIDIGGASRFHEDDYLGGTLFYNQGPIGRSR